MASSHAAFIFTDMDLVDMVTGMDMDMDMGMGKAMNMVAAITWKKSQALLQVLKSFLKDKQYLWARRLQHFTSVKKM